MNKKNIWRILGYNIDKSMIHLNSLKTLSKQAFWDRQKRDRDLILYHHINNNSWYRNFIRDECGLEWNSIPIVSKSDLQDFAINNSPPRQFFLNKIYFANTSGSSGHPLSFWKDKECHSLAWAKIYNSYQNLGININDKEARFVGHVKDSSKNYILELLKDIVFNRIRFDVFNISDRNFKSFFDIFKKNKVHYIYGYTNIILEFSKFLLKNNLSPLLDVSNHLKLCIVTAEMCFEADRLIIEKALGVPVFKEYGSSETSIIAIQNNQFNWDVSTDRLWVEVLDDNNNPVSDGIEGKIVVTDLYNKDFPFIRYDVGDIGSIENVDTFPYLHLNSLIGRQSDMIYLPSGKQAPGLTFYYISRSILFKKQIIKEFRIIQKQLNLFKFLIVAEKELGSSEKNEIIIAASKYLEPDLIFEFEMVDKIDNCYSTKIQHFFSELKRV